MFFSYFSFVRFFTIFLTCRKENFVMSGVSSTNCLYHRQSQLNHSQNVKTNRQQNTFCLLCLCCTHCGWWHVLVRKTLPTILQFPDYNFSSFLCKLNDDNKFTLKQRLAVQCKYFGKRSFATVGREIFLLVRGCFLKGCLIWHSMSYSNEENRCERNGEMRGCMCTATMV